MFVSLRRTRLTTALIALITLMFMQLAMAVHVCPGAAAPVVEIAAMAKAGTPCADSASMNMNNAPSNLCQAHCQSDQQSAHTYQLPPLATFSTVLAVIPFTITPVPLGVPLQAPHLRRSTAPSLAVRYCCFRI